MDQELGDLRTVRLVLQKAITSLENGSRV